VISQSAPHIYLSALPFAPKQSLISQQYLPQFPNTISLLTGKAASWPAIPHVLTWHSGAVLSVSFSPDGERVVSGSEDKTIRIWDIETGDMVSGPFRGHNDGVLSVSFSPDGKRVVSGSRDKTIRIWDVETGDIVSGPFRGHTDSVNSVSFSPNGKRVVSESFDDTIRIWDVETGDMVSGPFRGHDDGVMSDSFLSGSKRYFSGLFDKTIRISGVWGDTVAGPFRGHDGIVNSVSFSPNGKRIVSGSDDKTIRIWDVETRDIGHDHGVKESPTPFHDNSLMQDGWILGTNSESLFWVPPMHRKALWRPSNVCVIGSNSTRLDFSRFVHGTSWRSCRK